MKSRYFRMLRSVLQFVISQRNQMRAIDDAVGLVIGSVPLLFQAPTKHRSFFQNTIVYAYRYSYN